MGNLNFDATNIAPSQSFDPLPPGWYAVRITKAEMSPTEKAGNMLKLEHELDENTHPEHKGRKVFTNLCINHPNDQPREIAQRTLSAIAHAIGELRLANTDQLLGKSLRCKLKVVPAREGFEAKNEVTGYKPLNEATAPVAAPAAQAAPAPAARPGWKR